MKNVTVSLDDESYRRSRVRAAQDGKSLSAVVREFLSAYGGEETEFERLKRLEQELYAEMDQKGLGLTAAGNLSRDELYDERFER